MKIYAAFRTSGQLSLRQVRSLRWCLYHTAVSVCVCAYVSVFRLDVNK